ncbi:hypothetical protein TrVGV298_001781 [Trichoderma virens]|nr:hypothetical protein TrVGV298_001781 [Trichoderma virens]
MNQSFRDGNQTTAQILDPLRVGPRTLRWIQHWQNLAAEHHITESLQNDAINPNNSTTNYNFFDCLLIRALCPARDLVSIIGRLRNRGFLQGNGVHEIDIDLRRLIVECHAVTLGAFSALLSVLQCDLSLLPILEAPGTTRAAIYPAQRDALVEVVRAMTDAIYQQISTVHSVLSRLPQMRFLRPQQQIEALAELPWPLIMESASLRSHVFPSVQPLGGVPLDPIAYSSAIEAFITEREREVCGILRAIQQRIPPA